MQESLKKEREAEELKYNLFVRNPQYREDKSGYMWKQGVLLKDWKRRYFFIKNSQLVYLRGEEEVTYTDLSMSKSSEIPDHEHLYALEIISMSPQKKVQLLAESEADMKEWVYALRKSCEQGLLGFSESEFACADCLSLSPEWCSINLGVLLCTGCSSIHRSLGSHISKIRSLFLDNLDSVLKDVIIEIHKNHQIVWGEGHRPPRYSSTEEKEEYVRNKYMHRSWVPKVDAPGTALVNAVKESNVVRAFQAVLAGARVGENGVLHLAAKSGSVQVVALLVNLGWEIESKNSDSFTPLEVALLANQNPVVEYIVKIIES